MTPSSPCHPSVSGKALGPRRSAALRELGHGRSRRRRRPVRPDRRRPRRRSGADGALAGAVEAAGRPAGDRTVVMSTPARGAALLARATSPRRDRLDPSVRDTECLRPHAPGKHWVAGNTPGGGLGVVVEGGHSRSARVVRLPARWMRARTGDTRSAPTHRSLGDERRGNVAPADQSTPGSSQPASTRYRVRRQPAAAVPRPSHGIDDIVDLSETHASGGHLGGRAGCTRRRSGVSSRATAPRWG